MLQTTTTADTHCDCGDITGEPCAWSGPSAETVLVEHMPEWLRASHENAGYSGSYPSNGAERVRCATDCAERLAENDPEWVRIVERAS